MKFKKDDTILVRAKVEKVDTDITVRFDGDQFLTAMAKTKLSKAVKYEPDIPLPGQEVWVSFREGYWEKEPYIYCFHNPYNGRHKVVSKTGIDLWCLYVTTESSHKNNINAEIDEIEQRMGNDLNRLKKLRRALLENQDENTKGA